MSIENECQLDALREAGRITTDALNALQTHTVEGVTTAELDAIAKSILLRNGARPAPALVYGFPGTVLISVNEEIVHGIPGDRRLNHGDVVSLDVTVEKDGYYSDAARTIIVGVGSQIAHALVEAANESLRAALAVARAGVLINEIGRAVQNEVKRRRFTVVRGLCGHGIGRTIHEAPEVPNVFVRSQRDVLTDGMVLTIEPMVSAGTSYPLQSADGWTIRTSDGSLAAHCEHTIVITNGPPWILAA